MTQANTLAHLFSRFDGVDDCWVFHLAKNHDGYIRINLGGRKIMAHRAALMWRGIEVPPKMEVDHLCRNRACCNPDHLEVVTHRENMRRGNGMDRVHAAKTHCFRGHEFDAANTYVAKNGSRTCRICRRMKDRIRDASPERKSRRQVQR